MDPPSSMASWTCSTQVRAHLCEISCVRWVLSASPSQLLTSWAGLRDTHLAALADTIIAYPIVQQVLSMYITNRLLPLRVMAVAAYCSLRPYLCCIPTIDSIDAEPRHGCGCRQHHRCPDCAKQPGGEQ